MRFRFADCVFDGDRFELRRGGEPVPAQPKVLRLLAHLLEHAERAVSKDELFEAVWPGTATGESSLTRAVSLARDAIGDDGGSVIRTVRGRGYRIAVPVARESPGAGEPEVGAPEADFLCREREFALARGALHEALAGRGHVLLLAGEAGIGKTRLATELARVARQRGAHVFWGRCHQGEGRPAYWPWVQILRAAVAEWGASALARRAGPSASDLAELVPELRAAVPGPPRPSLGAPEQVRFRLFDAAASMLRSVAAEQPLVLVLDDLHFADAPSLLLLSFLAHQASEARILVMGTYRDAEAAATPALREALAEIARSGHPKRTIWMRGLTPACVRRFIEHMTGLQPSAALVEACHARTEGNPFFLLELLQWLLSREGPLPESLPVGGLGVPEGVRHVILRRLASLPERCRRLLTWGSTVGREFAAGLLARASDLDEAAVLAALGDAEQLRVVEPVRGSPGSFRFTHALIGEALYDELPTSERARLHRRVGEALEERRGARLAELAHHFYQASPAGDAGKALAYCTRAGDQAMAVLAFEEAARHYERAVQVIDAGSEAPRGARDTLLLSLADARYRSGEPDASGELLWQVVGGARASGDPELLAEAAIRLQTFKVGGNVLLAVPQRLRVLEEAARRLPPSDSPLRARLLAAIASEVFWSDEPERAHAALEEAKRIAARIGDPATSWEVSYARRLFWYASPDDETRGEWLDELLRLAEVTGDRLRELLTRAERLGDLVYRAEPEAIETELAACAALAEELRQPGASWTVLCARAARATWQGRFGEAEELLDQALVHGRHADRDQAALSRNAALVSLRRLQGRFGECEASLRQEGRLPRRRGHKAAALGLLFAESGRHALARREFESLAAGDFHDLRRDSNFVYNLALLAETCVSLGDNTRAERVHALLLPSAGRYVAIKTLATAGCASRYLAVLETLLGALREAESHFEEAVAVERRMGALPFEALALRDYARLLTARGGTGDRALARELRARASRIAREIGLAGVGGDAAS
jgi:DNA-binding winged helix-turn-helix (wHTH) protein